MDALKFVTRLLRQKVAQYAYIQTIKSTSTQ